MVLKQVIEAFDLLDNPQASAEQVADILQQRGLSTVTVDIVEGKKGKTGFLKAIIEGTKGKLTNGSAPTLGIIGRVGGIGARPQQVGIVSDADGALVAVACMLKLSDMKSRGDLLEGDLIVATNLCPTAPTKPHKPVPFMDSPVDMEVINRYEVDAEMDAIISNDATKANRFINQLGFAISPVVKQGYILRPSDEILEIMQTVSGAPPLLFPLTTADITPYSNEIYHINSIMQPSVVTNAPVLGVALTTEVPVAGCATGANHPLYLEAAVRFNLEVAKAFTSGLCPFYYQKDFDRLVSLYGSMKHLQKPGKNLK